MFPGEPGSVGFPLGSPPTMEEDLWELVVFTVLPAAVSLAISVKALKEYKALTPTIGLSSFTAELLAEGTLLPLDWLSNTRINDTCTY